MKKVSEKKTIKSDYKKTICYRLLPFKKFQYFEDYFYSKNFKITKKKRDIYN